MTLAEKQAFLAEPRVGVLSIPRRDIGPLTVPAWYDYGPGGTLWFTTGANSQKGRLLDLGTRVSLCAQNDAPPYRYVSIERPVTAIDPLEDEMLPTADRNFGEDQGRVFAKSTHQQRWRFSTQTSSSAAQSSFRIRRGGPTPNFGANVG